MAEAAVRLPQSQRPSIRFQRSFTQYEYRRKMRLNLGLLTKQPTFSIRQLAGKKKDAPWRHPNHFIILLRFKAVAERRQWSSAAPKPRRKTRVRLCPHF